MTTKEEIQTSINSRLTTKATKIEGGTIQDIIGSISYELANIIDTKIETILDNAFIVSADEIHLELKGRELNIIRKPASYALLDAKITNADSEIIIPEGTKAKTKTNIVFETTTNVKTNADGQAEVQMQCLTPGNAGNIKAGELDSFYEQYEGLEYASITNLSPAHDGYDIEDIEQYRKRILEYLKDDTANSNISDYIFWAKSVQGVKHVEVKDAMELNAPGHVDIYISSDNNKEVTPTLLNTVKTRIQTEQIINAYVSVYPLNYLEINVSAELVLNENTNINEVKSAFINLLNSYLDDKLNYVSYLYISNLLFEIEGVLDVKNYLLNNSDVSINVQKLQVPVTGEISLVQIQNGE